jgi:hypothetical protein
MKKTHVPHKTHLNIAEMFSKNIGILGLVVVILFFLVYFMLNRMDSLSYKVMVLESKEAENMKMIEELKSSAPAKE